jgi:hypothetical protein
VLFPPMPYRAHLTQLVVGSEDDIDLEGCHALSGPLRKVAPAMPVEAKLIPWESHAFLRCARMWTVAVKILMAKTRSVSGFKLSPAILRLLEHSRFLVAAM